jgi:5-methylcytosine-specific restriction endonuclease McrA
MTEEQKQRNAEYRREWSRDHPRKQSKQDRNATLAIWRAKRRKELREYAREFARQPARKAKQQAYLAQRKKEKAEYDAAYRKAWKAAHPLESSVRATNKTARRKSAPGRFTVAEMEHLFRIQKGRCAGCGTALQTKGTARYHRDHVVPVARKGTNSADNMQLLCAPCNLSKGARDPYEWANSLGKLFV